jgi:hypothetical protein
MISMVSLMWLSVFSQYVISDSNTTKNLEACRGLQGCVKVQGNE